MRLKAVFVFILGVLMLMIFLYRYFIWGIGSPDPRITFKELGGLTPDQITARFGPARQDPRVWDARHPNPPPKIVEKLKGGTFEMEYSDLELKSGFFHPHFGHFYTIQFVDGHVVDVSLSVEGGMN